ncbi:MAG: protein translocase SEC61 complex subunit gamma [Methanobacterium sp.]
MNLNMETISQFLRQCRRVLYVSKRPDRDEYINVAKITGIGVIIIGVIGFVISLIAQLLSYL